MRTREAMGTPAAWAAAHKKRWRCARPGCASEGQPAEEGAELCFTCTLEAELFDRDARWAGTHPARRGVAAAGGRRERRR